MNKEDLKTGMMVELRNGDLFKVFKDTISGDLLISENNTTDFLHNYTGDFMRKGFSDKYDIVKIYSNHYNHLKYQIKDYDMESYNLIWVEGFTEEAKEMTIVEIEEELGYEIVIKK